LVQLFAIELTALFALLPTSTNLGDTSIPFELHVFLACAPSLVSQQRKVESIENLSRLIKLCKEPVWAARRLQDDKAVALWTNRVERLGMLLADLLVEHKVSFLQFLPWNLERESQDETQNAIDHFVGKLSPYFMHWIY
jgi:hypothetical protein